MEILYQLHYAGAWTTEFYWTPTVNKIYSYYDEYMKDMELNLCYHIDEKTGIVWETFHCLQIGKEGEDVMVFGEVPHIDPGNL